MLLACFAKMLSGFHFKNVEKAITTLDGPNHIRYLNSKTKGFILGVLFTYCINKDVALLFYLSSKSYSVFFHSVNLLYYLQQPMNERPHYVLSEPTERLFHVSKNLSLGNVTLRRGTPL